MDSRKIEELSGFATFLEFLKNPQPVADTITELNAAVAEWRQTNEKARGIKSVDDWRAKALQDIAAQQAAVDQHKAESEAAVAKERAALQKSIDSHEKARATLAEGRKLLDKKLAEVTAMLAEKDEIAKDRARLDEKEQRLSALERSLADRLAKVKTLMEGS